MDTLKPVFLVIILLFSIITSAQSIVGKWKTIDDETGKTKSIVEIFMKEGKAYGKIIKLFREKGQNPDPICKECTDYRKGKKVLGMTIITHMVKKGNEWVDGEILDPNNGKIYDCKLWVENGQLKVRGYIAFFFRTQTWIRVE
ncbi:MAG: DUF2147 domain-containing protein [Vicingus serpentipes]|nr:DUF2147 domain-containing protein [Vicingus serpentipes]